MTDEQRFGLDAESLSLIAAARDMHEPSAENRARVRWKLELGLMSGAAVAGYSASALAATAKVVGAIAALGLASTGAWYLGSRSPTASTPQPLRPVATAVALAATSVAPPPVAALPPVVKAVPRRLPLHAEVSDTGQGLAGEIELLRRANTALNHGDGVGALSALSDYDHRYKSGRLFAERSAARVFALCRVGNVEAAASEGQRFLARWPHSPLAGRIAASCAPLARARGRAP